MKQETKPLSYSELKLWEEDRTSWESKYVLGIREKPTEAMALGSYIHSMLFTGEVSEKIEHTEKMKHVCDTIRKQYDKIVPKLNWQYEKKVEVTIAGIPMIGYFDGYDGGYNKEETLLEVKTGSVLWPPERAEGHDQLDFYNLLSLFTYKPLEKSYLLSLSTKSGKGVMYDINPSTEKAMKMQERAFNMWDWLEKEQLVNKRINSKDQIEI